MATLDPLVLADKVMPEERCTLGEGPCVARNSVAWVDIEERRLYLRDRSGFAEQRFELSNKVALVLQAGPFALDLISIEGVQRFNPQTGSLGSAGCLRVSPSGKTFAVPDPLEILL
jgi:hypothetical protein